MRRFHHLTSISDVSNFSVFSSFRVLLGFPIKRLGADCGRVKHEGHILSPWTSQPEVGVPLHLGKMNTLNCKNGGGWFRWYYRNFNSSDLGRFQLFKISRVWPRILTNRSWFFVIIDVWCPNVTPSSRGRASDWKLFRKEGWFVDPFVWDSPRFWGTWLFYLPYSQRQFFLPRFQWMVWSRIEGSSEFSESVGSST